MALFNFVANADDKIVSPSDVNQLQKSPPTYKESIAQPIAKIAIDVGHSKETSGALSSRGIAEYEFNLSLAKRIQSVLAPENDPRAFLIYSEPDIPLTKRTRIAYNKNATFFLSVHHDSAVAQYLDTWNWKGKTYYHTHKYSGFGLFVSRKNPHYEQSLKCASAIGAALQGAGFHYSDHHSAHIAGENREWADKANGVYIYDNLVVLKTAKTPAVLLEAGVIVNPNEEQWLKRSKTKDKIAAAVKAGLLQCGVYY
ncbi:MAG TPA: N-acetylmuramoyl-L-alanine amidase, partial [Pseudomonadales bacterium]|nr:N-acetylmuramoyl-L-alanine amidase [Pseudomonadales bacterium]